MTGLLNAQGAPMTVANFSACVHVGEAEFFVNEGRLSLYVGGEFRGGEDLLTAIPKLESILGAAKLAAHEGDDGA